MTEDDLTPPVGANDHVAGRDDAPLTLVEYGDYECPYCGMAYPILKRLQRKLGDDLRFVFRNFPLREAHPHAQHAAEGAEAVAVDGNDEFWKMHDLIYEHQSALEDKDLVRYARTAGADADRVARELETHVHAKHVRDDFRSGVKSGVNGTPTFFINGARYEGPWADEAKFLAALREAVAQART
jgi:formate-nitrite transporter family protein